MFKHISVHDLLEYKKLDKKWLSEEEIEECNKKACSIFKERLDSPEWGI